MQCSNLKIGLSTVVAGLRRLKEPLYSGKKPVNCFSHAHHGGKSHSKPNFIMDDVSNAI